MGKENNIGIEARSAVTVLEDFILPSKIEAFCEQYEPIDHWIDGCDVFTDYQLRAYFKAVVCPLGDPLSLYIQELKWRGYCMHNDVCGEPVIYVKQRKN